MTRVEFIQKYKPLALEIYKAYGIFPELLFSQAIIESSSSSGSFGSNYNAAKGNNYFGIKTSKSWQGDTIVNPQVKSESNIFRAYSSPAESIKDYALFLRSNRRYKEAGVFEATTWQQQAERIARAGYAGAGNESHYINLITKVGASVNKTLDLAAGKVKEVVKAGAKTVSSNKGKTIAIITAAALALYVLSKQRSNG